MFDCGLVLEGGGMRGVFTDGVLDCFMDNGIFFEEVWGVSAGACAACSYLSGQRGRAWRTMTEFLGEPEYCSVKSLIKTGDLFGADFNYNKVPNILIPYDYDAFLAQKSEFRAVVTNCESGQAEYPLLTDLRRDMLWVRASSSLPLVSRMVKINGGLYLDGGIADSVPHRAVRSLRAESGRRDRTAVILTQPKGYVKKPDGSIPAKLKYKSYPELKNAILTRAERYNESVAALWDAEREGRAFVIAPPAPLGLSRTEKDIPKLKAAYDLGYSEAEKRLGELREYAE